MTKNMGILDRTLRVLLAIVVGILYYTGSISGTVALLLGIFAVVFVLTSVIGFCPLYLPLRINTAGKK